MTPFPSALLTAVMLLCGSAAVAAMLYRLGRPEGERGPRLLMLHRVLGWSFVALFLVVGAAMLPRFYAYWEEDSPRVVFHYTAAFAILALLPLKVAVVRACPALRQHLFAMGLVVFLLAFLLAASVFPHYLVRATQRLPYISHAVVSGTLDEELGKQLLIERCSTCHVLDRVLQPRHPAAWEGVVNAMTKLAWPRIRPDEAKQILHYLTTVRVPREPSVGTGVDLLDKHCLPCHEPAEILATPRTRPAWDKIVSTMSGAAPDLVPASKHDRIVDALVGAQLKDPTPR